MADDTTPKWENLPPEFKMEVVGHLDVNARGSFLKSSESNKSYGELVPYDFRFVKISPQSFVPGEPLTFLFETNDSTKIVDQAEVVMGILSIFKHKRSKVETLEIGLLHEDVINKSLYRLTKDLLRTIAAQILDGSQVSLKVKNFIWHGPVKDIRFPELLSHFSKDHLVSMYLSIKGDIPVDVMDGIMDTEQWQQLKSLRVTARIHDNVGIFNHLEKVEVDVHGMNPAMFADFVKVRLESILIAFELVLFSNFIRKIFHMNHTLLSIAHSNLIKSLRCMCTNWLMQMSLIL
ncbi:hypothetical protein CAEBREN_12642 [Caenorhabditis brenneri]|uniref:DUF38 domain-containing protein n=1 Tax=Caenorhabditis brenneri TaxID=135651 RepID=G0N0L0_CAEBE|nr:hypothetical protein CAEBREN_12642 [Caenorhabditis brenneri]